MLFFFVLLVFVYAPPPAPIDVPPHMRKPLSLLCGTVFIVLALARAWQFHQQGRKGSTVFFVLLALIQVGGFSLILGD